MACHLQDRDCTMSYDNHLKLLKWLTIQDCLNQNYYSNGISNELNQKMCNECASFLSKNLIIMDKQNYKISYKSIHFVIQKKYQSKL